MSTVTVDNTWLGIAGNSLHGDSLAPYKLSLDNTIYQLAQDVNVATSGYFGQVFVFTGKEIYLDLNGFAVRINGKSVEQEILSQKASTNLYKAVPTGVIRNQGGVVFLPNNTTQEVSLDAARKDLPVVNPEKF